MMDASTWGQKDVVEILLKKVDIDHQDKVLSFFGALLPYPNIYFLLNINRMELLP